MKSLPQILLLFSMLAAGCDADRVAKLEKDNAELKAKVDQQSAAVNYDLQAKCGKDARVWFNENWPSDKDTILLQFTDHYNAQKNRCFILVEYHYKSRLGVPDTASWTLDMNLYDVYENTKYGEFAENHSTHFKPTIGVGQEVITCEIDGSECKTIDEFKTAASPFMNN